MIALIHAELLKLRSTRVTAFLLLGALALVVLTAVVSVPKSGDENAPLSLDDPDLLAMVVGASFGVPLVLVVLLGGMAFTQEFRYGTVTSTYLVEPRRPRVLVAKWAALALASLVITTVTLAVSVPVGIALIGSRDGDVTIGAQFWQTVVAAYVVMAAYSVIGVAVGILVRNQIVAAVAVLIWMLAVEQIVVTSYPSVGKWMPWGVANALMQLGPEIDLEGKLLSVPAAALLLLVYTATAALLARLLTPKRDVL
jgi:ABC-2 type transport system permease protein